MAISGKQMRRLQTLWGKFCVHAQMDTRDRAARLNSVSAIIGRLIGSFSELTRDEANAAIRAIQKNLPEETWKRRPGRATARAYGTAGRKGNDSKEVRMADAETWRLLDFLLGKLGWSRERLDGFLRSNKSPVRGGIIRTLSDANRVIWVLKSLLRRAETCQAVPPSEKIVAPPSNC